MKHNFRLGFGPMSFEIVNILSTYASRGNPLMIIASRNQVDATSGYVMTTRTLVDYIGVKSDYLLMCRDHCGPYFLDSEKTLPGLAAIDATKKTIAADIDAGFDLIHIDTSRCLGTYQVAEELIKFSLDLNPNIMFEFGTEENIGVAAGISKYKEDVAFASQFPNMQFVVAQTGSLTSEDKQAGTFELDAVSELVNYAETAGVKLKEHNADYLTSDQIQLRRQAGVHALNIAPQLGVIQTRVIKDACLEYNLTEEWNDFSNAVIDSGKWQKWMIMGGGDELKVDVAGHYLFKHPSFHRIVYSLENLTDWRLTLEKEIVSLLELYENNL
jgi:fructose/tagatose bisphosphate aldolase